MERINALGRRKTAVARIILQDGTGKVTVNKKPSDVYFTTPALLYKLQQPFQLTDTVGKYDIIVNVDGGGITGQAEAIRLGISRALVEIDPEYKPELRKNGLMTRDPRMVERKKPGQKKARKKFQFSKR
jgi:small subunit ribosomal protein S9